MQYFFRPKYRWHLSFSRTLFCDSGQGGPLVSHDEHDARSSNGIAMDIHIVSCNLWRRCIFGWRFLGEDHANKTGCGLLVLNSMYLRTTVGINGIFRDTTEGTTLRLGHGNLISYWAGQCLRIRPSWTGHSCSREDPWRSNGCS